MTSRPISKLKAKAKTKAKTLTMKIFRAQVGVQITVIPRKAKQNKTFSCNYHAGWLDDWRCLKCPRDIHIV